MPTYFDSLSLPDFSAQTLFYLLLLGGGLLLLVVLIIRRVHKGPPGEWRIRRAISRLGVRYGKNLYVHNGIDGFFSVDYVVLSDEGICLILVKRFEGAIYAGEHIEEWTQVIRGGSYRFPNPLLQLQLVISTVKILLPKVPIQGKVLFAGDCQFPKDKPEGVWLLAELPKKRPQQEVSESYQKAWEHLIASAQST
jgi:hypothetical protein